MNKLRHVALGALLLTSAFARPASAHFHLTAPPSWLKEDPAAVGGGGPQKGSPCGPGGIDDVQPIPTSGIVTDFHVGQTIELDWIDTIAHPGYFRIALAANRADLKDPTIKQDSSCSFDETMVPKTASGNVLADGVLFRSRNGFNAPAGTKFTYMVQLPDTPCDKCTLQVMQVMEADIQGLSNCHYFHCADIRILPADAGGGTGGASNGGATSGSGGTLGGAGMGMTVGMGGLTTTSSGGDMSGIAGMLGLGGTTTPPTGTGATVGTTTPPSGSGGAMAGTGTITPPETGGATAVGGGAGFGGETNGAATSEDTGSSCAVALRTHAKGSALSGFALLALFGLARRRRANGTARK
ncbi:MAG TPA: SCE4755 family polysaccharide monooxygenase-like protein [Polyangiaceae bacterium]|jgi:hypothetical protein|nr:SCE4755 family polysaccharide monooxygenase-like protein [Polyangiaceae bacterium]